MSKLFDGEDYEQKVQALCKSATPATVGMLSQMGDLFVKSLRQKFAQRDARIAALEARTEALELQLAALRHGGQG
jgi:hypothetical protein